MTTLAALTPDDLYATARHFHVDLAAEPFLIALIKQAAITPLPPQWTELPRRPTSSSTATATATARREVGGDAARHGARFRNELTGEIQDAHPADAYFVKQIHELRRHYGRGEQPNDEDEDVSGERGGARGSIDAEVDADPAHGWMEFEGGGDGTGGDRAKYYYDFVSKTRQDARPRAPLCDQGTVVGNGAAGSSAGAADPRAFDQAASLHKQSSMKNIDSLEILCFTSWWTESALTGSRKSFLHIYFSIPTRHFQVVLDDADDVFTISHLVSATGRVVSAWDLHVGARIQLLGRWTTLMQPSLLTRQWLELHETRLRAMQRELGTELLKYELTSQTGKQRGTREPGSGGGRIECAAPHKSASGTSLRVLRTEIDALKARLAKYRPDVARRFVLPADVDDM